MSTYEQLSMFTYGEIEALNLTYGELSSISDEHLAILAKNKLKRFKENADDSPAPEELRERIVQVTNIVNNHNLSVPEKNNWTKSAAFEVFKALLSVSSGLVLVWLKIYFGIS